MARIILDSSVLISIYYEGDAHCEIVRNYMSGKNNNYLISAISLAETLTHASGKGTGAVEHMVGHIRAAVTEIFDVNQEIAIAAAAVRARKGIKMPDAIISATATLVGAELWTLNQKLAKAHKGAILIA